MDIKALQYPVGPFVANRNPEKELVEKWITIIAAFPRQIEQLTKNLPKEALSWNYRPDGWSVKQVVHHCADSHMNALIRFKLTLTEETPTIRPYMEARWAKLEDGQEEDLSHSLAIIKGIHHRWAVLLNALSTEDLQLEYHHPEYNKRFNLAEALGNYEWHCRHHLAHIENGIQSKGTYNS